jgi:hypothetical protein
MTYGVEVKIPTAIVKSLGLLDQTGSATPISVGAGNGEASANPYAQG